jgi:DNA-binding HxlR family transcriptional regulator
VERGGVPFAEAIEEACSQWRPVVLHDLADCEKRLDELKRSTDACPARQSVRHEPGT